MPFQKGNKLGKKFTSESQKDFTPWNKGKTNIYSGTTRKNIGDTLKRKGIKPPTRLGSKHSEETRKKMSIKRRGLKHWWSGMSENHPLYKGGISKKSGYHNIYGARYRYRKLKISGSHTFAEWQTLKAQYNWTCPCCHKSEPEIKLTEDHIIPISKCGSNNIENIQPLCRSCNSKKYASVKLFINKKDDAGQ